MSYALLPNAAIMVLRACLVHCSWLMSPAVHSFYKQEMHNLGSVRKYRKLPKFKIWDKWKEPLRDSHSLSKALKSFSDNQINLFYQVLMAVKDFSGLSGFRGILDSVYFSVQYEFKYRNLDGWDLGATLEEMNQIRKPITEEKWNQFFDNWFKENGTEEEYFLHSDGLCNMTCFFCESASRKRFLVETMPSEPPKTSWLNGVRARLNSWWHGS